MYNHCPIEVTHLIPPLHALHATRFINQYTSWRWTYYTLIIWIGVQTVAMFFIPETYAPTLTNHKAARFVPIFCPMILFRS